ncbi:DNA alkylation repair protein [Actibacterium sp. 188UL27-1]|uniref:DNA alkylation repair protein n=1 Tax=Actibacterium sp. 188UL27-1 TaxID=2786961 RepID=UPI00195C07B9|nr:DNA alkylation repair protein [Actibacterium sp. 188UL27-1]MBM7067791.1 DNA alkylation repair protein [Actibacterium sp. 188UL27-1]
MTPEAALDALRAKADPGKAADMAAYHKADRPYLGVANPVLDDLAKGWRQSLDVPQRVNLARALWHTNIHEARMAAAKLLTQARLRPDDAAWDLIQSWAPDFDAWAIADHACMAGQRRLLADPGRVDQVAEWTQSDHMWTRRAALVITLPWTKQNHPTEQDLAIRDRVLGWAADYVSDKEWFIQKAVAWWLRDLSKHDPSRVVTFLEKHGATMKPFARNDAARKLPTDLKTGHS